MLAGIILGHFFVLWFSSDLSEPSLACEFDFDARHPSPPTSRDQEAESVEKRGTDNLLPVSLTRSPRNRTLGNWDELPRLKPAGKVWVVTPTYNRIQQYMLLTRTFQALYPARHFTNWIVVDQTEYSNKMKFAKLKQFLRGFQMSMRVIKSKPRGKNEVIVGAPKGVEGRRTALEYLRSLPSDFVGDSDIVFFADDDNVYDSDLLRQVRRSFKPLTLWKLNL